MSINENIAMGRVHMNYDPLELLTTLRANVGYNAGWCIRLSESQLKWIDDVIAFNTGGDTNVQG